MREVVLDTETTGRSPEKGHRIIEIGCVELIDRRITKRRFHVYLNPGREIDPGALRVHGLTLEFLRDKPTFPEVAHDFLEFIRGSRLVIHNAPFDLGFLNMELSLCGLGRVEEHCLEVVDTLLLARRKHPVQKNSLDALCKRYQIDHSQRELHGALLDAELLARVYLAMTGGQESLLFAEEKRKRRKVGRRARRLKLLKAKDEELKEHQAFLELLRERAGSHLW